MFFNQTVFERMLGAGDLGVESAGEAGRQTFYAIRKPNLVQQEIYRAMEKLEHRDYQRMGQATADAMRPTPRQPRLRRRFPSRSSSSTTCVARAPSPTPSSRPRSATSSTGCERLRRPPRLRVARIAYDVAGDEADPPIVLIPGLGAQLIFYEDEFVQGSIDRYFRVVRIDNRDCGLSSAGRRCAWSTPRRCSTAPHHRRRTGSPTWPPTSSPCSIISASTAAHVLGTSLGGMIAQVLAIEHPDRVASLTLAQLHQRRARRRAADTRRRSLRCWPRRPPAPTATSSVAYDVETRRAWATPEYYDLDWAPSTSARRTTVPVPPTAPAASSAALFAEPDREAQLRTLAVPTLVVHGTADPLIAPSGGERLAELIDGAELLMLDGMAHDLPPHYWAPLIEAVTRLVVRAAT